MSDSEPFSTTATDREYARSFFVAVCLLAVVLASGAFATVTAAPGVDTASAVGPLSFTLPDGTELGSQPVGGGAGGGAGGSSLPLSGGFVPPNIAVGGSFDAGSGGSFDAGSGGSFDVGTGIGAGAGGGAGGASGTGSGTFAGTGSGTFAGTGSGARSGAGSITGSGIEIGFGGGAAAGDGYTLRSNRSLTPGATVALTVTNDDDPVTGATVTFNGEPVGVTDSQGTVVGTVPYSPQLSVAVSSDPFSSLAPPAGPASQARLFSVAPVGPQQVANESFDVDTNVTLSLSGPPRRGANLTLTATIRDVPMRQAAVTMDGQPVGTTDDRGRVRLRLPEASGPVTLTVQRDSIDGSRTVQVGDFVIETAPALPLALPGLPTDVLVRVGGAPVSNATVTLDGDRSLRTDANGTATASLPLASSTTVTVTKNGYREQRAIDGLFLNLAAVLTAALAAVGSAGYGLRRWGVTRDTVRDRLRRAAQFALRVLFDTAAALDTVLYAFVARCRETLASLRRLLARRTSPGELWTAFQQWVQQTLASLARAADAAVAAARAADPRTDNDAAKDPQPTIQEAWGRFVACVSVRRLATSTPGEIATHATEVDGLPPDAVATLREAFRAVEYGQRDPADRIGAVETAIQLIERAAGRTATDETEGHSP